MTEISKKDHYVDLFRKNKFNVFPIEPNTKVADNRYKGQGKTIPNQKISKTENYGILPTKDGKNCIVDLDNKERYRKFAESMINEGYMVIETPHGWHVPIINLGNFATKIELFDYSFQQKKIIEIQGWLHYVIGPESQIIDDDGEIKKYTNRGNDKIWDAKGISYDEFVNGICKNCSVESVVLKNAGSYKYLRDQFIKNKLPPVGHSNHYFHQAARVCLTDGDTRDEAFDRIRRIYNKWSESKNFSHRPWSNIEYKINEVYDNPDKFKITLGRTKDSGHELDRTQIGRDLIDEREIYSNSKTHEIWENKNGFLEKINDTLKKELQNQYPEMETSDYQQILFKLEGFAGDLPETNLDYIRFPNGTFDIKTRKIVKTDEIADMGFNQYNYLEKTKDNEPTEFLKFLKSYPESEHPRLKAGLRSIFSGYHDPRISVLHGISRVGKTTLLSIICKLLGDEYAYSVDLEIFLEDRATMSEIVGKRLVVFQDLPENWKNFVPIKNITGESQINIRGFNKKAENTPNKIKIFATANQLPAIKESVKNAMYSARLSLIHNIEKKQFKEDGQLEKRIIENEGEKIISWIINLSDKECAYEDKDTIEKEWEELANPQEKWLESEYVITTDLDNKIPVKSLCNLFEAWSENSMKISIEQMTISLKTLGYSVYDNIVKNIITKPKPSTLMKTADETTPTKKRTQ